MAKKEETKEIKKTQATKTTKKVESKNNKKKDSKKKPSKVKKENYFPVLRKFCVNTRSGIAVVVSMFTISMNVECPV